MTKADLIAIIAKEADLTKSAAEIFLNLFLTTATNLLISEKKLFLSNFGTFLVNIQKQRMGYNPKTGKPIQIHEKNIIKFRSAKYLKDAIRKCN